MFLFFLCIAALLPFPSSAALPFVTIRNGTLTGGQCASNPSAVFYKSVPYAQPPIGDLRFAPPQAYAQKYLGGTLDASVPAVNCIQFDAAGIEQGPQSEDCLLLDIYAPANATADSALPVRVWLYGGGNLAGAISDPLYDGCNVTNTNAILVAVNYRLGPLGFLAVKDAGISGNQAIQDILLSLQWVQDNIAAFGGDPRKVLLHGQSAGAYNTFTVATLPQAPKLMAAAIMESGGGRDSAPYEIEPKVGASYAQGLNCSTSDAACLRRASVADLKKTVLTLPLLNSKKLAAAALESGTAYTFKPHVDGTVIPRQPSDVGVQVPAIFGTNAVEGNLFALQQFPRGPQTATAANYTQFITENFPAAAVPSVQQAYPLAAFNGTPYPAFAAISTFVTLASYLCPAHRGLRTAAANGVPVWTFRFDHRPHCPWLPLPASALPLLGATHTSELPFVFGWESRQPRPNGTCSMTAAEQALTAFIGASWRSMAATRSPAGEAAWPKWEAEKSQGIIFGDAATPGNVNYTGCELWDKIDRMMLDGPGSGGSNGSAVSPANASPSSAVLTGLAVGVAVDVVTGVVLVVGAVVALSL